MTHMSDLYFFKYLTNSQVWIFKGRFDTPLEHTPGNPPSQLWKKSLFSLLVKVARGVCSKGLLKQPLRFCLNPNDIQNPSDECHVGGTVLPRSSLASRWLVLETTLTPTEVAAAKCKMLFLQLWSWAMFGIIFVWIDWNQAVCQEIMMMVMIVDDGDIWWRWWRLLLMMED